MNPLNKSTLNSVLAGNNKLLTNNKNLDTAINSNIENLSIINIK